MIGIVGSTLLGLCGIPLLLSALRDPKTIKDINLYFLIMWFLGEILTAAYYFGNLGLDIPTLLNYGINTTITGYLLFRRIYDISK